MQPTIEVKNGQQIVCETQFIAKNNFLNKKILVNTVKNLKPLTLLAVTAHLVHCTQLMPLVSALYGSL